MVNNRTFKLKTGSNLQGDVLYWMSREQRVEDNWTLIAAYNESILRKSSLRVVFALADNFLGATQRHFRFMTDGLRHVSLKLQDLNIHFQVLIGSPVEMVSNFVNQSNICIIYTDFDPLRIKREWKKSVASMVDATMIEVDSHNIVPCRLTSDKQEFAAYTIRPKLKRLLPEYLTDIPKLDIHTFNSNVSNNFPVINLSGFAADNSKPVLFVPGEDAAMATLNDFIINKFNDYSKYRNYPELNHQSDLSPYLHFGQISAQRIAVEASKAVVDPESKDAFLEELIIRRELSDNFCFYNQYYDQFIGFPEWAQKTLNEHADDKRQYIYSIQQLENSLTHDIYWNAAQTEMVVTGKMHGYMRMYWAKKILEWTENPVQALEIAIFLNDKYSLDGRDPNGYTGIAWSIGGVHDRAWTERNIFGKIRYMNDGGLKRKFNIDMYVHRVRKVAQ